MLPGTDNKLSDFIFFVHGKEWAIDGPLTKNGTIIHRKYNAKIHRGRFSNLTRRKERPLNVPAH